MKNTPRDIYKVARTAKGYQARQRILIATAELLGDKGIDNVTVLAICEQANIGRTTLYNYFKDANEAIQALLGEFAIEIQAQFELIHGGRPRGMSRMAYCLRFLMERAWRDPVWGKLAVSLRNAGPHFDDYLEAQISLEIAAAIEASEINLATQEQSALTPFICSIVADMVKKLSNKEVQLKDITPVIALILRAAGMEPHVAEEATSQRISRALIGRSWLVPDS